LRDAARVALVPPLALGEFSGELGSIFGYEHKTYIVGCA
jgi:hypothetical protein